MTLSGFNVNTKPEQAEKWEPVEGIITPVARAVVEEDHTGLLVNLIFSEMVAGLQTDLRISFGRVLAYTVYDDMLHPWTAARPELRLAEPWAMYFYPLLQIHNSSWADSVPNLLFFHPKCIHYRLLTLDQIVDVLSNQAPAVSWVKAVES